MTIAYPISAIRENLTLVIIDSFLVAIASAAVCLRLWSRHLAKVGLGLDDYLILASTVMRIPRVGFFDFGSSLVTKPLCRSSSTPSMYSPSWTSYTACVGTSPASLPETSSYSSRCVYVRNHGSGILADNESPDAHPLPTPLRLRHGRGEIFLPRLLRPAVRRQAFFQAVGVRAHGYGPVLVDWQHVADLPHLSTAGVELGCHFARHLWEQAVGIRPSGCTQHCDGCWHYCPSPAVCSLVAVAGVEEVGACGYV